MAKRALPSAIPSSVKFGLAGSSSGAFSVMDQTIRMMVTMMAARNSTRSRNGQTCTSFCHPELGQVRISWLFEWRVQRDGPDHQDDGDDDGRQKFHAQQEWPNVHFLLPSRPERPGLAVMRFCLGGISFQFRDEFVVGVRLLPRQINVEGQQRNHRNDRNVVRSRENSPELFPIHGYFFASLTSESRTTGAGPEMPPSFRTRQKCTIINTEAMMGMPIQCQM